ncbi:MAG: hypothetical protein WA373_03230 [Burkholderiales bacterium]
MPGEVLRQAAEGIRGTFGEQSVRIQGKAAPSYTTETPAGTITVASEFIDAGKSTIALTEFHWGVVTGLIRLSRPLDAIRNFAGVLQVLPTLALSSASPVAAKRFARVIGWLEAAACLVMLLSVVFAVAEAIVNPAVFMDIARSAAHSTSTTGADRQAMPQFVWVMIAGMGVVYLVLFLVLPCLLVAYAINVFNSEKRGSYARLILAVIGATGVNLLSLLVAIFLFSAVLVPFQASVAISSDPLLAVGIIGGLLFLVLIVRAIAGVAGLVRDVAIYLGRETQGEPLEVQRRIQDELLALIGKIQQASPGTAIVLVCHSLGTVIATDLLHREATRPGGARLEVDLVTAGSPLRRMIHRMLPQRALPPLQLRALLRGGTPVVVRRWFNCFRVLDFVGQSLSYSFFCFTRLFRQRPVANDPVAGIFEYRLAPWINRRLGHGNYWADPRFVRFIAAEVLALD